MTDHSPAPEPAHSPRFRVLAGGTAVLVLAVVAVTIAVTRGSRASSVQEVADQTVTAAVELDVNAGIQLLCDPPSLDQRDALLDAIRQGQADAGSRKPAFEIVVGNVTGDRSGSFEVIVPHRERALEVEVREEDGRSCISDVDGLAILGSTFTQR